MKISVDPSGLLCRLLLLFLTLSSVCSAGENVIAAPRVKATYIFNFIKLVDWPEGSFGSADAPIIVCVLGEEQIADSLAALLKDKKAKERPFVVKSSEYPRDLTMCHLTYVGPHSSKVPEKTMRDFSLSPAHTLVVGDAPGAAEQGAVINFFQNDKKIQFEVNLALARKEGFNISYQMLQLARIVGSPGGGK